MAPTRRTPPQDPDAGRCRRRRDNGRRLAVLVFTLALPAVVAGCGSSSLSGSSSCNDFLDAPPDQQEQVLNQLAAQYHVPDYAGAVMGMEEIGYECAGDPNATLDQRFQHDAAENAG